MNRRLFTAMAVVVGLGYLLSSMHTIGANANAPMINGRVRDETGKALGGVDVYVIDLAGKETHIDSKPDGTYQLPSPSQSEVRVVLFDTNDANAMRITVALHIDGSANNHVNWILRPLNSLDKETRENLLRILKQITEQTKSEAFQTKANKFF